MWYRSRSPGQEFSPTRVIHQSSDGPRPVRSKSSSPRNVVWSFGGFLPSHPPPSSMQLAGGRRTSEKAASARMTEHISSFSTDFRIGSLPCVCVQDCWTALLAKLSRGRTLKTTNIHSVCILEPVFVSEIWPGQVKKHLYESRASNVSQLFTNFVPNSVIHSLSRCRAPPI